MVPTAVPFTMVDNQPTVIHVQTADKRKWQMSVRIAVVQVIESGQPHPTTPGIPMFGIQATLVTDTKEIKEPT